MSTRVGVIIQKREDPLAYTLEYEREIETQSKQPPESSTDVLFKNAGQDGVCLDGQLTDLGRESGLEFGKQLRELYVEQLGLLPSTFTDPSELYMR